MIFSSRVNYRHRLDAQNVLPVTVNYTSNLTLSLVYQATFSDYLMFLSDRPPSNTMCNSSSVAGSEFSLVLVYSVNPDIQKDVGVCFAVTGIQSVG